MSTGDKQVAPRPRWQAPLNDGQLIGNLPPELFIKILEDVSFLHRTAGLKFDTNRVARYQLVCHRWRDAICSTPQFWQEISIRSSPRWLELSLTRCAGLPATVIVWHPTYPVETFATLCRHASSIRACYFHSVAPDMLSLSGLSSLLATHMPQLETLSIDSAYHDQERIDVPITHELVPRLTTLNLRSCVAPSDATVYASLRSLTLSRAVWSFSYGDLLDMLGKCHRLEHLSLDEEALDPFIGEIEHFAMDYPTVVTPAGLPRLESMRISGQCDVLFHLLDNIHAPQARTVELMDCLDDHDSGPLLTRLLPPGLHRRVPVLSAPRVVYLSCWDWAPFHLSLRCGPDGHALFAVDYGSVYNEHWPGNVNLEPNLAAVMDLFPLASVDTIEVVGCLDEVAAETWQRVFAACSGLRTLHVRGRGTLDALWLGLRRATRASLEHGGAACCPVLSAVIAGYPDRGFTATAALLRSIPETLRARAAAGAGRLKKLQLRLDYSSELCRRTVVARSTFVDDVGTLVGELDYRDWEESLWGRALVGLRMPMVTLRVSGHEVLDP